MRGKEKGDDLSCEPSTVQTSQPCCCAAMQSEVLPDTNDRSSPDPPEFLPGEGGSSTKVERRHSQPLVTKGALELLFCIPYSSKSNINRIIYARQNVA